MSTSERLNQQILEIDEVTIGASLSTGISPTTERTLRLNSEINLFMCHVLYLTYAGANTINAIFSKLFCCKCFFLLGSVAKSTPLSINLGQTSRVKIFQMLCLSCYNYVLGKNSKTRCERVKIIYCHLFLLEEYQKVLGLYFGNIQHR